MRQRGESQIRIILPQIQPVFGTAGKQTVRFHDLLGGDVICKHAQIGVVSAEFHAGKSGGIACSIQSGNQSLTGSLLISAGSVDLPCVIQPFPLTDPQSPVQFFRKDEIVFNGIGIAGDFGVLQTGNGPQDFCLHIRRKTGGKSVQIIFSGVGSFRFQINVMTFMLGKTYYFILKRGAVPCSDPLDQTIIHGGFIQIIPDKLCRFRTGMCHITGQILPAGRQFLSGKGFRKKAEAFIRIFRFLRIHGRKVNALCQKPGRRTGFQSAHMEIQLIPQSLCQLYGGGISGSSAGKIPQTVMEFSGKKSSGGNYYAFGKETFSEFGFHSADCVRTFQYK